MKLNNKGFTLIEVLAVIVILGILATVMIPAVGSMIVKNKEDNYKNLENSITSAAKIYISDYRYEIKLDPSQKCDDANTERNIIEINGAGLTTPSQITLKNLVDANVLSTNKENKIINPKNDKELNLDTSYITVTYSCSKKDYEYKDIELNEIE